jgi:hypothetical protein
MTDTFPEVTELVRSLERSESDLRADTLFYLIAALAPSDRDRLRQAIRATRRQDLMDALNKAEALGPAPDAVSVADLRTYLSRLGDEDSTRGAGSTTYGFARAYWDNFKRRTAQALCDDSPDYNDIRRQLRQTGRTSITVSVPVLTSLLTLPPELSGFAIILSIFVAKVGVDTLCDTLRQTLSAGGGSET